MMTESRSKVIGNSLFGFLFVLMFLMGPKIFAQFPLRKATGVWICGGHLTNLLDAYLDTRTEREIQAVAERGGVIGGSSAGAMIQGSFLIDGLKEM